MALSSDLVSQFAKITKDDKNTNRESTVYGTVVEYEGSNYVRIDGSDLLTPVATTTDANPGERVTVMIKNHSATITGNMSSPSARTDDVKDVATEVTEVSDKVSEFDTVIAGKISAEEADIKYATIENLNATNANIENLQADHGEFKTLTTDKFTAIDASIENLEVTKLSTESADIKYANIDFANIGDAAVENFYAKSGVIQDVVMQDGQVTGTLVGVTIKGDLIEGGTVVADKLVIKGDDGLYYKLNTDGETVSSQQTEYNSLSGTIITAKSVTAEKIAVSDLVAFDATIGGFNITESSLYSGVKASVDNTTRGVYLDNTGQIAFGDTNNFLKYFRDEDGTWKLEISAGSVTIGSSNKNVEEVIGDAIVKSVEEFYQSTSPVSLVGGSWSTTQPTWTEGTYIWRRTAVTYGDGRSEYTPSSTGVCITGNTGAAGEDGTGVNILGSYDTEAELNAAHPTGSERDAYIVAGDMYIWDAKNSKWKNVGRIQGPQGESGVGIASVTEYYAVSTSNSTAPTSWQKTVPTMTETNKYLWNYETIKYTNDSTEDTEKRVIGVYGDKGATGASGVGISSVTEYYAVSSSNSTVPTSWQNTVPTMTATNKYLWNYEVTTYTDNTTSSTSKRVIGVYGDKGIDGASGVGISYITNYYLTTSASTGVTTSTSGWSTTPTSTTTIKKYLWNYEKVTYTDGSTSDTTPHVIGTHGATGSDGEKGDDGVGISSVTNYYLASESSSGVTASTSGWTTTVQSVSSSKKYLWNYEVISYTDGTTTSTAPCIIGTYGDTGEPGIDFSQGKMLYTDPMFADSVNGTMKVANNGVNYLALERVAKSTDNPMTGTDYEMVITNTGPVEPPNGGFGWGHETRANAIFVYRIVAKIPTGRSLIFRGNTSGTGGNFRWITSNAGTGKFTEYIARLECGGSGSFNRSGMFVIDGAAGTSSLPLVWYVAYATVFDMTNVSDIDTKLQETADNIYQVINEQNTEITNTCEEIVLSATQNYVEKSEFSEYKENVSSEFSVMADKMEMNFTNISSNITSVDEDLQSTKTDLSKYIRFSVDGIEIGEEGNSLLLTLDNDMIAFVKNGKTVAYWDGNTLRTGNLHVDVNERAQFGDFAYIPRSDGSLMFLKVGE